MNATLAKPCRILYISSTYSRDEGDNQKPWMIDTIRRLKARGFEIRVLAPSFKGFRTRIAGGVKIHRFRYFFAARENLTHDHGGPNLTVRLPPASKCRRSFANGGRKMYRHSIPPAYRWVRHGGRGAG